MLKNFKHKIPDTLLTLAGTFSSFRQNFGLRYPLQVSDKECGPFFIVGCGRSGNTLLRKMLVCGEEVVIPPESYMLPKLMRHFVMYNYLPWNMLSAGIVSEFEAYPEFYTWGVDVCSVYKRVRMLPEEKRTLGDILDLFYKEYASQIGGRIVSWGDKTPINSLYVDRLSNVFPKAKFVHMLRDPRATTASYLNANLKPDVKSAVDFWIKATKSIQRLKSQFPEKVHTVQYESLVQAPEDELKKVCVHIGIEFQPRMLEYWKFNAGLGDVEVHKHHSNTSNKLSIDSLDKWKSQLSKEDAHYIETKCHNIYEFKS